MGNYDQTWPAESLDAISLWIPRSQVKIKGSDENLVRLSGSDDGGWAPQMIQPEINGRWLNLRYWDEHSSPGEVVLSVPRDKAWVIELSAWKGDVEIRDVLGRLMIAVQRGSIDMVRCRGMATINTGDGNLNVSGWKEQPVPDRPPTVAQPAGTSPAEPGFEDFQIPGPQEWFDWGPKDWTDWGTRFGGQARVWAQQFGHFWHQMGWQWPKSGLSLHAGKSDVMLTDVEAQACTIRTSKGDARVEDGAIDNLIVSSSHGDILVEGVYPLQTWDLKTTQGDIRLSLPADAQVRLDAATRQGDLHSEIPLVRVARPGPESRRGGRLVGTMGTAETARAEISLATLHGDIEIVRGKATRRAPAAQSAANQPGQAWQMPPVTPPVPPVPPIPPTPPIPPGDYDPTAEGIVDLANQVVPEAGSGVGLAEPESEQAQPDPVMAILQALREGAISVEEADRLIESQLASRA
jgi:hypothetical protein